MTEIKNDLLYVFSTLHKVDSHSTFVEDTISGKSRSYHDFYKDVVEASNAIKSKQLPNTLFLILPNSYRLLIMYFACLISDRIASPIDPTKSQDEMQKITAGIKDSCIVVDDSFNYDLKTHPTILIDHIFSETTETTANTVDEFFDSINAVDFNKPFLITYTSGTSGIAKGVIHSAGNLFLCALAFKNKLQINSSNVFLHVMPMTYMAGILNTIILPFLSGSKIVLAERFSPTFAMKFWNVVTKHNANTFWLSPTMLAILMKIDRSKDGVEYCKSKDTTWYIGTAPLNNVLKNSFEDKYRVRLLQSYGLSETLFLASVTKETHSLPDPGVGTTLDGVVMTQQKDDELLVNVPWMFLGYTNEKTENYFAGNSYITGDIGCFDNNVLKITDRKKDLIIRGGMNISPKAIENIVLSNESVDDVAVISGYDNLMGETIVCVIVSKQGVETDPLKQKITSDVRRLGNGYAIDKVIFMDKLPYNTNGKLDKVALRKMV